MAMDQYCHGAAVRTGLNKENESSLNKWKSVSDVDAVADIPSSGFDCNICLDFVQDPVVTLCGHLYCWPCIYKWLHFQTISTMNLDHQQQAQCPVCKAEISSTTLVPLYCPGQATKPSSKGNAPQLGLVIPRRPSGPACWDTLSQTATTNPQPTHQLHYRSYPHQSESYYNTHPDGYYPTSPMLNLGGSTTTSNAAFHPMIGMFVEMVYARVFGNSVTNLHNYPNSYHLAGNSSPRARRHVMQADKSLGRICFFLFCCILLCLVFF